MELTYVKVHFIMHLSLWELLAPLERIYPSLLYSFPLYIFVK
uniref:Uncharacterized protein n=1 Tax=Arundo donax TaxID=35708 RepID=A0A0A8ZQB8_ARUDO